jgi:hypothetical protein
MKVYRRLEGFQQCLLSRKEGDQATSDGSAPNPKAIGPDDVLIERAAHRNYQREE